MSDAGENRRHCASCNKVITDFSGMSDEELLRYFRKNGNLCGRFSPMQLNRIIEQPQQEKRLWSKLLVPVFLTLAQIAGAPVQAQPAQNSKKQSHTITKSSATAASKTTTANGNTHILPTLTQPGKITISGQVTNTDTLCLRLAWITISTRYDTAKVYTDANGNYTATVSAKINDSISLKCFTMGFELSEDTLVVKPGTANFLCNFKLMKEPVLPPVSSYTVKFETCNFVMGEIVSNRQSRFKRLLNKIKRPFRRL
jgi:hypothetical protein